jgi:hypothetical protein
MTYVHRRAGSAARLVLIAAACAAVVPSFPAGAQATPERPAYRAQRIDAEIRVDGQLDESAWSAAPTFELAYETRPAENTPAPMKTEVWIVYDSSNLYAAFRAHDPDPSRIRARFSDRDAAFNDDFVGLVLDTFHDRRRAFEFFVNPLGVQMDLSQNEMTGNEDESWDAIWDSAGRLTPDGYEVEIRIPFSSLRFPSTAGEMTWGIDAVRIVPRDQRYRLGLNPQARGNNCYLCQASDLTGIAGVRPAKSIEFDPTLTASATRQRAALGGSFGSEETEVEPGLTAHWGITPNMTFTGAINPDFSQVEADAAQLAVNTQFALFFPEKRPFFLEGADLFETRFNAIYSRNIADPEWGLKLTGKSGKNAVGAIVAVDRRTNFLLPSSQGSSLATVDDENLSTILRYRRDLFGATTGGFFYTGREGDGYHNRLLGGDILFRWQDGVKAMRVELMGSTTQDPDAISAITGGSGEELTGHGFRTVFQHTSREWMYYLIYRDIAKDFRADLGFVPQVDIRQVGAALERAWYPQKRGWSEFRLGTEPNNTEDQEGQHLERNVNLYAWARGPRQSFLRVDVTEGDRFSIDDTFDTDRLTLYGEFQAHPDVFVTGQVITGNQVDFANARQGEQLRIDPGLRWNAGRHLRLNFNHFYDTLDVEGGTLFTANLTELRATYQFNNRTFVRWIGQHLDVERDRSLYTFEVEAHSRDFFNQLLFSYKVNPITVLFLGYSDTWYGNEQFAAEQQSATLFFKVGYAWQV